MKTIQAWFKEHSVHTHTLVALWLGAETLWYTNPDFKSYVWGIYHALPRPLYAAIQGIGIPVALYAMAKNKLTAGSQK